MSQMENKGVGGKDLQTKFSRVASSRAHLFRCEIKTFLESPD